MVTSTQANLERDRNFPYNFLVNVVDGGFFGLGIGFASFVTMLPLFVSTLTDSALLIGLIPAIHVVGWQLPQLFMAQRVTKQRQYKPMVLMLTIQERLPFLFMALVAWFVPKIGPQLALGLAFLLLVWQGLGGGVTAVAWQAMIGKIVPGDRWGLFFGVQGAAANLLMGFSAIVAGQILQRYSSPWDFTVCFLITSGAMAVSWVFLSLTRESHTPQEALPEQGGQFWGDLKAILKKDLNFRWFIGVRMLAQVASMGFAFYTVYAVRVHGVNEATAGILTGVLTFVSTLANPLMGWLGDRWSHRGLMGVGILAAILSALVAWQARGEGWFYAIFTLAGIANVGLWTIAMAMTLEYGSEAERPTYIGLANTLVGPVAFLIPLLGGWLADSVGYSATFLVSAAGGLAALWVLAFRLKDNKRQAL